MHNCHTNPLPKTASLNRVWVANCIHNKVWGCAEIFPNRLLCPRIQSCFKDFVVFKYSRLPTTRTFQGNWKSFELSGVRGFELLGVYCTLLKFCLIRVKPSAIRLYKNHAPFHMNAFMQFCFISLMYRSDRFPALNSLIQRINVRKRRDSIILASVISICIILMLIYALG